MKREYRLFIEDILECIVKIEEFTKGMVFKEFVKDDKTKSAVVHKLEIIGEATKNIPKHIKALYKEVPWSDMAKMRDKLSHWYFGIRHEIVWNVVKERLPEIKPVIEKMLKELNDRTESEL